MNKRIIEDTINNASFTDKIKIRYFHTSLIVEKRFIHYDLDFKNKILWIKKINTNEEFVIDTRTIKSIEIKPSEMLSHDQEQNIAKVGEI